MSKDANTDALLSDSIQERFKAMKELEVSQYKMVFRKPDGAPVAYILMAYGEMAEVLEKALSPVIDELDERVNGSSNN